AVGNSVGVGDAVGVAVNVGVAVGVSVGVGVRVGVLVAVGEGVAVRVFVGDALAVAATSGGTIAGSALRRDHAHAPPAPPPISSTTPATTAQRCQADLEVGVWVLPSVLVIAAVVAARACGSLAVVWLSGVRQNGQICHSGRTTWLHCGQWGSVATGTPAGRVIWALASPSLPVPGAAFSVCSGLARLPLGPLVRPCC